VHENNKLNYCNTQDSSYTKALGSCENVRLAMTWHFCNQLWHVSWQVAELL